MWGWGRGITALLFVISQCLMGLYLAKSSMGSAYGPAGSLVLLLAWVYYASLVCLFGAECAAVYAHSYGSRAAPRDVPPLPALAESDEHRSCDVSSTMDTSTLRTQKGKMHP
jgi:uncharacterized BrkB/YihY/UPF0761 family membrane protein